MGNVRLYGATSGYTELAPPAVAPDGVLSLPSGTGTIAKTTDQGLVHINTTTFSAVSSVSLNNVFSATYENYLIIANKLIASNAANFLMRLRASGSDATGANYTYQELGANGGSVSAGRTSGATQASTGVVRVDSNGCDTSFNLFRPQLATATNYATGTVYDAFSAAYISLIVGSHSLATAYDGATFFISPGTMSGTIRVYGYKND